MQFKSW